MIDFSKPRQVYKELFGVDMPKEVEAVISKLCLVYNVRPDNMEITHYLINGWLQEKLRAIPEAAAARTKHTGDIIAATLKAAGNEFIEQSTKRAAEIAEMRFNNAREEFTHHATAEIKRLASEAKKLAPSQYRIFANGVLGASILAALSLGYVVGGYRTKTALIDELRVSPAGAGIKEFTSLDVQVNGQDVVGFKLSAGDRISFYPKKETADKEKESPKLPDK